MASGDGGTEAARIMVYLVSPECNTWQQDPLATLRRRSVLSYRNLQMKYYEIISRRVEMEIRDSVTKRRQAIMILEKKLPEELGLRLGGRGHGWQQCWIYANETASQGIY
jgi:hypothetical protein